MYAHRILTLIVSSQQRPIFGRLRIRKNANCFAIRSFAFAALALSVPPLEASPVSLDPTFGTSGIVVTPRESGGEGATAMAIQADGKIVLLGPDSGKFALARYQKNGTLDDTFGVSGKVVIQVGANPHPYSVAIQQNGMIVSGGVTYQRGHADFVLTRHTVSGNLDPTFGTAGIVTEGNGILRDLAIQTDGKIIVAGSLTAGSKTNCVIARFNPNGTLDSTFGVGGRVITRFGEGYDSFNSVTIQTDGRLIAAGHSNNGMNTDFALARYTSRGVLDKTFGVEGKATTDFFSKNDYANAVAVQADGKIVVGGQAEWGNYDFALARYQPNGTLDESFGYSGKYTDELSPYYHERYYFDDVCEDIAIQPDGKILAAGHVNFSGGSDIRFVLARYKADGQPDTTFGKRGFAVAKLGFYGSGEALALLPGGKAVVAGAGEKVEGDGWGMALARFYGGVQQADVRFGFDSQVKRGNNVYSGGGLVQTQPIEFSGKGTTKALFIGIENDGTHPCSFKVKCPAGNTSFSVKYFHGAINVTDEVVNGTLITHKLNRREIYLLKAKITALTSTSGKMRNFYASVEPKGSSDGTDYVLIPATLR